MNRRPALTIAFLVASLGPAARAQKKDTEGDIATDVRFSKNAGASELAELKAIRLALKQSSANVKKFAQTLIDEHTQANEELES